MNPIWKALAAGSAVLILVAGAVFWLAEGRAQNAEVPAPSTQTAFVPDQSPSEGAAEQPICADAFARVIAEAAAKRGRVIVEAIDGNPMQDSRTPIDVRFSVPAQFVDNETYSQAILSQLQVQAMDRYRRLMSERPATPGTDVLSAIELAARDLEPSGSAAPTIKRLVVCSDMLNSRPPFNFYRVDMTPRGIKRIVSRLASMGRLPSLAGVRVYIVGIGQSSRGHVSAMKAHQLVAFWSSYFTKACHAPAVSFTSVLSNFP